MVPEERISRFLSFLLRHDPKEFSLRFDRQGFVAWSQLLTKVQERFSEVTEDQIFAIVEGADKKRFELVAGKVRATYGHSFPALAVGKRRDPSPAVLIVDSQTAHANGVQFYSSSHLFLTEEVPANFLILWEGSEN